MHNLGFMKEFVWQEVWKWITTAKVRGNGKQKPTLISTFKHSLNWDQRRLLSRTHDDDVGHALEGGLFDLGDIVVMDAQLLQALGHVGGHVLECVPGQVEALQLGERAKGLVVNGADLVVHKDQSLCGRDRKKSFDCHTCSFFPTSGDEAAHCWSLKFEHYGFILYLKHTLEATMLYLTAFRHMPS